MGLFSKGKSPEEKKALADARVNDHLRRESEKALKFVASDGTDVSGALFAVESLEELSKVIKPRIVLFPDRVLKVSGNLLMRGNEFIPIEKISSVDISGGIIPSVTIHTTGDAINFKSDSISGPHFVELLRGLISRERSGREMGLGSSRSVDELEKLAALYEKGILTEEEFKIEKAKILSS